MKDIGGFFSLELSYFNNMPHLDGILLNSGRNSLQYILESKTNISKVYIPYYTCEVVLEPFEKLQIPYEFYCIDENLEINESIALAEGEYLLYTNYFGVKDEYVRKLSSLYGNSLIVDNAQSFFSEPTGNCFYSPRKFVGVPDGGIAYSSTDDVNHGVKLLFDESYGRCIHLLKRIDIGASLAYSDFVTNDEKLINNPLKRMSHLTFEILKCIDFKGIKEKRIKNFKFLHSQLCHNNLLSIDNVENLSCPMVYPFRNALGSNLRRLLIDQHIFVAKYWPNIEYWCPPDSVEYDLCNSILPLPIDQRYDEDDLARICYQINKILK